MEPYKKNMMVCPNCGYIGKGQVRGHILIELMLWLVYIIPGLIYSIWRLSAKRTVCPECGYHAMLSVHTRKGRIMVNDFLEKEKKVMGE